MKCCKITAKAPSLSLVPLITKTWGTDMILTVCVWLTMKMAFDELDVIKYWGAGVKKEEVTGANKSFKTFNNSQPSSFYLKTNRL